MIVVVFSFLLNLAIDKYGANIVKNFIICDYKVKFLLNYLQIMIFLYESFDNQERE